MSLRSSPGWPMPCSGAMYEGVPTIAPVAVSWVAPPPEKILAMPKSVRMTLPCLSIMTLAGLTSR